MSLTSAHNEFFQELERRMESLSPRTNFGITRDRWLILAAAIGGVLAFIPWTRLTEPDAAILLTLSGLALQLIGVSLLAYRQARDVLPDFRDAKRKFAVELDDYFMGREHVLGWLRTLPSEVRHSRLAYVAARQAALQARFALAFGAVDKLGVLPVFVGVFVQAQGLATLSWPAKVLIVGITMLYLMALWTVGYRAQLEGYERILRAVEA